LISTFWKIFNECEWYVPMGIVVLLMEQNGTFYEAGAVYFARKPSTNRRKPSAFDVGLHGETPFPGGGLTRMKNRTYWWL
jgi:hypothetical protein